VVEHGQLADATFGEGDVDRLLDIDVEQLPKRLEEIRQTLTTVRRPG
jgi:hypothetical protein